MKRALTEQASSSRAQQMIPVKVELLRGEILQLTMHREETIWHLKEIVAGALIIPSEFQKALQGERICPDDDVVREENYQIVVSLEAMESFLQGGHGNHGKE